MRALSVLISAAAGAARERSAEGVARIEARLGDGLRGATLGGARLRVARRGVRISRDPGALAGRVDGAAGVSALALPMDASIVWDGRLALTAHAPGLRIAFTQGAASITTPEGEAFSLEEATAQGLISAAWLLEQHVQHRLSPIFTAKSGLMTREKSAAFTGP